MEPKSPSSTKRLVLKNNRREHCGNPTQISWSTRGIRDLVERIFPNKQLGNDKLAPHVTRQIRAEYSDKVMKDESRVGLLEGSNRIIVAMMILGNGIRKKDVGAIATIGHFPALIALRTQSEKYKQT